MICQCKRCAKLTEVEQVCILQQEKDKITELFEAYKAKYDSLQPVQVPVEQFDRNLKYGGIYVDEHIKYIKQEIAEELAQFINIIFSTFNENIINSYGKNLIARFLNARVSVHMLDLHDYNNNEEMDNEESVFDDLYTKWITNPENLPTISYPTVNEGAWH